MTTESTLIAIEERDLSQADSILFTLPPICEI